MPSGSLFHRKGKSISWAHVKWQASLENITSLWATLPQPLRASELNGGIRACETTKQIQPHSSQLGEMRPYEAESLSVDSFDHSVCTKFSFKSTRLVRNVLKYLLFIFNYCQQYFTNFFFSQLITTFISISWRVNISSVSKSDGWIKERREIVRGGSILLFKKSSDPPLRWQSWICRAKGQLFNWIRKHSLSEMQRTDGEMSKQRLCPTHLDILLEL